MSGDALVSRVAEVDRAIRTLLPGLRSANYVERWAPGSPAVRALNILCEQVGESAEIPGDDQDPDVPTVHARRPTGDPLPEWVADLIVSERAAAAVEALESAADEWSEWESFTASDGHISIRMHGKTPRQWLRDRAATYRSTNTTPTKGTQR